MYIESIVNRVANPVGFYPDPTFEIKPYTYPTFEGKKPDSGPTLDCTLYTYSPTYSNLLN